jgi:fructose-1,6-bisphosphatase/inositol monophosphatase family enzyme
MQSTDTILSFAKDTALEAGEIILRYFDAAEQGVEIKADQSPVTIADKQINQLVIDRVEATFPEHGILAEEGSSHQHRNELWVCDPIDGTKTYILGVPTAVFSLAYVVDGCPEVAVIFDPYQGKLYSAAKGRGAFVNDRPLHASEVAALERTNLAGPTSYAQLKVRRVFYDNLLNLGVKQLIVPGNVFKSTLVASGNIDAYIFPGKSAHDVAAAKLIVEEAGGKVTDLYGKEQRYDGAIYGAIITNGHLHDELVRLMADFGPENYIGY